MVLLSIFNNLAFSSFISYEENSEAIDQFTDSCKNVLMDYVAKLDKRFETIIIWMLKMFNISS